MERPIQSNPKIINDDTTKKELEASETDTPVIINNYQAHNKSFDTIVLPDGKELK